MKENKVNKKIEYTDARSTLSAITIRSHESILEIL